MPSAQSLGIAVMHMTSDHNPNLAFDMPASILDVLLPDTVARILKLLSDTPKSIVDFSLTCSHANSIITDTNLWRDLCMQLTDSFPAQLRCQDWRPAAWNAASYKELYIRLLLPYAPLLQQRIWHTSKMPAGQLLVVDAHPPMVVAKSIHYRQLQGTAFSHSIFEVSLAEGKGPANVYCCCCRRVPEVESELASVAVATGYTGSNPFQSILREAVGQLTFRSHHALLQFLKPSAGSPASATTEAVYPSVASAGHPGGDNGSHAATASDQQGHAGFSFRCLTPCGNVYTEHMARWFADPYQQTLGSSAQGHAPSQAASAAGTSAAAAALARAMAAQPVGQLAPGPADPSAQPGPDASMHSGSLHEGTTGTTSSSTSSSGGSQLLLPDVTPYSMTRWDLRHFYDERALPPSWTSKVEYRPFSNSAWLCPGPEPVMAASPSSRKLMVDEPAASTAREGGQLQSALAVSTEASSASAAALTGLWLGTYGSHGVEVLQLQLLQAPPGFNLFLNHPMPDAPPDDIDDCPRGVLLQSVLHRPGLEIHPQTRLEADLPPDDHAAAGDDDGADGVDNPAAAAIQGAAGDVARSGDAAAKLTQQEQQQLLLVATKVTGDRNVPAGQVTFAVDLGSRSEAGAGQPLQLPPLVHSAVEVNAPGTRPLVIKERYRGLAQIASIYFSVPRVTAVELLVFEDSDALGLMWAPPMDTFSFFVRLPGLP